MRDKPSRRVTPLVLLVLSLTGWQAIRLWTAIAWYDVLREFAPKPGPLYTALSGAFWLGLGLVLLMNIWQKTVRTAKMLIWAAAGYTVWYWIDRLVFQTPHANWLFDLLVNIALLTYILAITIPQFSSDEFLKRGL